MEFLNNKNEDNLKITAGKLVGGWSYIDMEVGEKKHHIEASYLGDSLATLVDRLYYLYPKPGHDAYDFENIEYGSCKGHLEYSDGKTETVLWDDVPKATSMQLDEEGYLWTLSVEREVTLDCDFDVRLTIKNTDGEAESFGMKYKDLCYAVAKCCTEVIKRYGLSGYVDSSLDRDINLRRLIFIKAVALGCTESIACNQETESDISRELALLMLDMLQSP